MNNPAYFPLFLGALFVLLLLVYVIGWTLRRQRKQVKELENLLRESHQRMATLNRIQAQRAAADANAIKASRPLSAPVPRASSSSSSPPSSSYNDGILRHARMSAIMYGGDGRAGAANSSSRDSGPSGSSDRGFE